MAAVLHVTRKHEFKLVPDRDRPGRSDCQRRQQRTAPGLRGTADRTMHVRSPRHLVPLNDCANIH